MKYLLSLLFITITSLMACTGDCLTCHPKLIPTINEDLRHKPMLTCINCHSADPNSMAECGSDCFGCHRVEKIEKVDVKEHDIIRTCRDCHLEMENEALDITGISGQSTQKPLKDFLLQ